jgi:hypothetical protein
MIKALFYRCTGTAALSHRKLAAAGTSRVRCGAQFIDIVAVNTVQFRAFVETSVNVRATQNGISSPTG